MQKLILCGSRKYESLNFDSLVDSFEIIVRHNWLSNTYGYGKRHANLQILNDHMYAYWVTQEYNLQQISKFYASYGHDRKSIEAFRGYIGHCDKIVYFKQNNRALLEELNIPGKFGLKPRCGVASILQCLKDGIKPFLIGYSLNDDQFSDHATNRIVSRKRDNLGHSSDDEILLIRELHKKDLVDATFCMIQDNEHKFVIDTTIMNPKNESLEILEKIYGKDQISLGKQHD